MRALLLLVRCCWLVVLATALLPSLHPASVSAGGLYVNEFGTTSQANAGAGRGAWASDASATLHNPATMTRLDDQAFSTGLHLAFGNIRFDAEATSPSGVGNGGNQVGLAPLTSTNYVHRISDRLRFGMTLFSLSGSILDPDDDWAGRFEVTEISLLTVSLSPTLAVRVNDWLSVGAGPVLTYGLLDWDLSVDLPLGGEGKLRLDDLDDWQPAARGGLLFHPSDEFALSVYYNSETDFALSGEVSVPAGVGTNLDVDLPLAQFVEVSAFWQATDWLALLATFNWEDWSSADGLDVTVGTRRIQAATGFKDTYKFGLGANVQLKEGWLLQAGAMLDTSALSDSDRTVALPIDRQVRGAIGLRHDLSPNCTLGLSFVYVNLGSGRVRTANVSGDYSNNDLFVVGLTLDFKKLWWSGRFTR
jgi:long-chain fatty acid transport protein